MTTSASTPRRAAGPPPVLALATVYRLFLRGQVTRLRVVGLLVLGLVGILLAIVARRSDDVLQTSTDLLAGYGLAVVAPVCTLWIATSMLGEPTEDRLLAYLWLKPMGRWILPAAAVAASLTILVPLVVVPVTVAAAISGSSGLTSSALGASLLAVAAYSGIFVALGARFTRSLWWGLLYILVWENAVALISDGTARLAVRSYVVSIVSRETGVDIVVDGRSAVASLVVPVVIMVSGAAVATWFLRRRDVD